MNPVSIKNFIANTFYCDNWEIRYNSDGTPINNVSSYRGVYTKEKLAQYRSVVKDARKYIKGVKKFHKAFYTPNALNAMASAYTGKTTRTERNFYRIVHAQHVMLAIAEGAPIEITDYIDGTMTVSAGDAYVTTTY